MIVLLQRNNTVLVFGQSMKLHLFVYHTKFPTVTSGATSSVVPNQIAFSTF